MGRIYEAMFVVQNERARAEHEGIVSDLSSMIERAGGRVVNVEKWEERKLAYQISKHRRATYYLSHFDAPTDAVAKLDRMCRLSDWVLRALIVRDEDGTEIRSASEFQESQFEASDGERRGGYSRSRESSREARPAAPASDRPRADEREE